MFYLTNLEKIRQEKNMTQFKLSLASGIEQCRISNLENKRNDIDNARIETICRLAKALEVKAWEILNNETLSEMLQNVSRCDELDHDFWFEGTRLEEMRKRLNMTQTQLSNESYISQSKISCWKHGGIEKARIETICTLCIYLDCHPCDLIDDRKLRQKLRGVL